MIRFLLCFFLCLATPGWAHESADAAFQRKEFATARLLYEQARDQERANPERWLQYSAQVVRCCIALGESDRAVAEFFLICRVDPQTTFYDCLPLPWDPPPRQPGAPLAVEKAAEEVLKSRSPGSAAVLLAAGVLSVSAQQTNRTLGLDWLDRLSQQEGHAALLATAMLWKQQIPTLRIANELARLESLVEKIPEPYRAGPYLLLARAANTIGEREKAILYWMRLLIFYPNDRLLVEAATNEAAIALEKLGRQDQAARVRMRN